MSSYLTIKKQGVKICSFSRNTIFYEVLYERVSYDKWTECDIRDLNMGYDDLQEEISNCKKAIERENKALSLLTQKEDIFDTLSSIDSLQETLEEKVEALMYIKFLIHIWEQDKGGLEWILG